MARARAHFRPSGVCTRPFAPGAFQPLPGMNANKSLGWMNSPCGCVGTKRLRGGETLTEKGETQYNPDLMACWPLPRLAGFCRRNPTTNCSVGLRCIWCWWLGLSKQVYQLTCLAVDWCFICTHNQVTGVLELFMQCPAL